MGDPVTADFCTAIGLDSLRGVGTGLTPSFDTQQYPPGCSVALRDGTKPVAEVNLFADDGQPPTVSGRKTRVVSGLTVYVLPYDPTLGACERDVMATGIRLVVDAYGPGSATPPRRVSCAATDAMTNRLAEVVAAGTVPRLPVANPSLAALDGCKIVRKAGIAELGVFAGSEVIPRGFGVNCELKRTDLFLFFNFVIAESAQPGGTPETVEGHRLIRTDAADTHCSYVSPQGTTADGRHEQLTVTSTFIGATAPVDDLCAQTGQVLARYLTAARLR